MKKLVLAGILGLCLASSAMAQSAGNVVRWRGIEGVITAQGVNNPVSDNISSGTFAWSTRGGSAMVNLFNGTTSFQVQGLVINGTQFSGTAGPVTQVEGTLVCDAGTGLETTIDTAPVSLSSRGDAAFTGRIQGIPGDCGNPLFLIRIVNPAGALGAWIATGTERVTVDSRGHVSRDDD